MWITKRSSAPQSSRLLLQFGPTTEKLGLQLLMTTASLVQVLHPSPIHINGVTRALPPLTKTVLSFQVAPSVIGPGPQVVMPEVPTPSADARPLVPPKLSNSSNELY